MLFAALAAPPARNQVFEPQAYQDTCEVVLVAVPAMDIVRYHMNLARSLRHQAPARTFEGQPTL